MTSLVWWKAEEGKVYELLLPYVRTVEQRQADIYDRFIVHSAHYDPNGPDAEIGDAAYLRRLRGIKENVVATSVDTVRAEIAATEVRARFLTDGADWSTIQRADLLELYAEQLGRLLNIDEACRSAFASCAKKGIGAIKVYADEDDQIHVEALKVDNLIVDDRECENGASPRQLHHRQHNYDRDLLIQQFPEHEDVIDRAADAGTRAGWRNRVNYGAGGETRNDVLVCESWRLPMGRMPDGWDEMTAAKRKASRYVPGRHVIVVDGADLLDEEWHEADFPIVVGRWCEREGSWYGISLVERNIGHQRVLDKLNHQRDRAFEFAVPTMFVDWIDRDIAVKTSQAGNVVALKGGKPEVRVPQVIGVELDRARLDARASAIAEVGLPDIATHGVKAPGLESGASLREFKDQTSQRFSLQEKAFEWLKLGTVVKVLAVCKSLGSKAPRLVKQTRFGLEHIEWGDMEVDDLRVMIAAASTLARTPAGRMQTVLELAQAGVITQDESVELLDNPDLTKSTSQYAASLRAIEHDLEMIERGRYVIPEPHCNLDMAQRYAQWRYLTDRDLGAPEEVLDGLDAYAVTAADMLSRKAANANAAASMMGPGASPLSPVDVPMLPPGSPPMATPQQVPSSGPPLIPAGTGPMAA